MSYDGKVHRNGRHGEHGCHKDSSRQCVTRGTLAEEYCRGAGQQPQGPSGNMNEQNRRIGHRRLLRMYTWRLAGRFHPIPTVNPAPGKFSEIDALPNVRSSRLLRGWRRVTYDIKVRYATRFAALVGGTLLQPGWPRCRKRAPCPYAVSFTMRSTCTALIVSEDASSRVGRIGFIRSVRSAGFRSSASKVTTSVA